MNSTDEEIIHLLQNDFLYHSGWLESVRQRKIQKQGKAVPWITFPAIEFISRLKLEAYKILEVGAGHSSLYWTRNCKSLITCETELNWYLLVSKCLDKFENHRILLLNENQKNTFPESIIKIIDNKRDEMDFEGESLQFINKFGGHLFEVFSKNKDFDILFIDGVLRNFSCILGDFFAKKDSIIILDNAERHEYNFGKNFLLNQGWVEIPFVGLGPLNPYSWTTSIFLRNLNLFKNHKSP